MARYGIYPQGISAIVNDTESNLAATAYQANEISDMFPQKAGVSWSSYGTVEPHLVGPFQEILQLAATTAGAETLPQSWNFKEPGGGRRYFAAVREWLETLAKQLRAEGWMATVETVDGVEHFIAVESRS